MKREIVGAVRLTTHTMIRLNCGHERAIGGHVWPSGEPVIKPARLMLGQFYNCRDGRCGEMPELVRPVRGEEI
jgi:hypothetical protein